MERNVREKIRVRRIADAYEQLYKIMGVRGNRSGKQCSRNELLRRALQCLKQNTQLSPCAPHVESIITTAATTTSPHQLYANHSQQQEVWPVPDWSQTPPPCTPHMDVTHSEVHVWPASTHCSQSLSPSTSITTPPPHVQQNEVWPVPDWSQPLSPCTDGSVITTPPPHVPQQEVWPVPDWSQPPPPCAPQAYYFGQEELISTLSQPPRMMAINSCPLNRTATPYHTN